MKKILENVLLFVPAVVIWVLCVYILIPKKEVVACPYVERPKTVVINVVSISYEENEIEVEEPQVEEEPELKYVIDVTDEDKELMARVVMSESSLLCLDGKQAVAQTIVNRVLSDKFPNTVKEVVYQLNQYSVADNGEPNDECYTAVENALIYQGFPRDLYYYRTDYPHDFGYFYCSIGNTYFSTGKYDYNE